MKIVTLQIVITCSDEFYESHLKPVMGNQHTGDLCKQMIEDGGGEVTDVVATTDVKEA